MKKRKNTGQNARDIASSGRTMSKILSLSQFRMKRKIFGKGRVTNKFSIYNPSVIIIGIPLKFD